MQEAFHFQYVMCAAVVLTPKKQFYDWLNSTEPDYSPAAVSTGEPDIHLLPDFETVEEMEEWLEANFDWLFSEQMNNWYTDVPVVGKNPDFQHV